MSIQLAFQDDKLRQLCESYLSAKRRYGVQTARTLHTRLADVQACANVAELESLGFASVDRGEVARIFISVADGYTIFTVVNNRPEPRLRDGRLDSKRVTRLKIMSIERANEN
jgi:hypothetical protein